jgi:hypothetical protein
MSFGTSAVSRAGWYRSTSADSGKSATCSASAIVTAEVPKRRFASR